MTESVQRSKQCIVAQMALKRRTELSAIINRVNEMGRDRAAGTDWNDIRLAASVTAAVLVQADKVWSLYEELADSALPSPEEAEARRNSELVLLNAFDATLNGVEAWVDCAKVGLLKKGVTSLLTI